jgi:hypothetical protein
MYDKHEAFMQKHNVSSKLKAVERALGRSLWRLLIYILES